jgi:uncharacterized Fe-S cluster protein YjdI
VPQSSAADAQPEPTKVKADPHITEQRNRPQTDPVDAAEASDKAEAEKVAERKPEGALARLAAYKAEVEELLGGDSAARRRGKNTTASGLPAPDPTTQEPQIKLTRPPRKGGTRPKD